MHPSPNLGHFSCCYIVCRTKTDKEGPKPAVVAPVAPVSPPAATNAPAALAAGRNARIEAGGEGGGTAAASVAAAPASPADAPPVADGAAPTAPAAPQDKAGGDEKTSTTKPRRELVSMEDLPSAESSSSMPEGKTSEGEKKQRVADSAAESEEAVSEGEVEEIMTRRPKRFGAAVKELWKEKSGYLTPWSDSCSVECNLGPGESSRHALLFPEKGEERIVTASPQDVFTLHKALFLENPVAGQRTNDSSLVARAYCSGFRLMSHTNVSHTSHKMVVGVGFHAKNPAGPYVVLVYDLKKQALECPQLRDLSQETCFPEDRVDCDILAQNSAMIQTSIRSLYGAVDSGETDRKGIPARKLRPRPRCEVQ